MSNTPQTTAPLWLAAEDAAARAERAAGWHWAWDDGPADGELRQCLWTFTLDRPLSATRLTLAAQKGLPGVWLDGRLLHASKDGMAGRELQDLDLGDLAAGTHRLAVAVRTFHPFIQEPRQGGVGALLRSGDFFLAPRAADWRIRTGAEPGWHESDAPLDAAVWLPALLPAEPIDWLPTPAQAGRLMRRRFDLDAQLRSATLEITALGGYEARLNGRRVGDALLTPENSDFRVRLLLQSYDVTDMLRAGENVLGVTVADGFYASEAIGRGRYPFGAAPRRLWARLTLTLADGNTHVVTTDRDWQAAPAPTLFAEIYHGETHDARLEPAGWDAPGFDASGWDAVHTAPTPPCALMPQESPPIRATLTLQPRSIRRLANGDHVVDFGQNFAGWCRIRVRGEAGRTVTLRHAEILADDGQVDMRNLRAAQCTDRYTLRGDANGETWEPRFTYHGFRHVQVSGWPGELRAGDIDGVVVHSDLGVTGDLQSTQPIVQGLWHNTLWSQRSNFVGMPTDCPQRDERLGWTGDAQVFWPTAAFNMDVRGFTRRFLADLRASQRADGAYADTNPPALPAYGAHGWSDAGVVLPHTVWQHYGETAGIDEHWESMERWMAWIADVNPDGLWARRRDVDFGDWLSLDAKNLMEATTPKLLSATACWARMLGMMVQMAEATSRTQRGAHFAGWHERVVRAFREHFVRPDGHVGNGSHTSYILALAFGLVPKDLQMAAADRLAANIRERGTLLTTGFLGTPFSLDVLADHGHPALAVDLLLRTEYPSWGYMVERGATTIWERWNGDTGDVAMNSFNHYALGSVTGFLYRRVAGLASVAPGFKTVRCRPLLDPRLGDGRCCLQTDHGVIATAWGRDAQGQPWFEIALPEGVTGTVELPGHAATAIQAGKQRFSPRL
ncbi:family 78 glycoside hydrolase catalytic domain [Roseateles sp. BYS78W]|uniref:alpha-L-rhamnosidase n=1 Tax=Pelomonas candidula TaxID=3299025 RepID=A0ABW7HIP4_9BURK